MIKVKLTPIKEPIEGVCCVEIGTQWYTREVIADESETKD